MGLFLMVHGTTLAYSPPPKTFQKTLVNAFYTSQHWSSHFQTTLHTSRYCKILPSSWIFNPLKHSQSFGRIEPIQTSNIQLLSLSLRTGKLIFVHMASHQGGHVTSYVLRVLGTWFSSISVRILITHQSGAQANKFEITIIQYHRLLNSFFAYRPIWPPMLSYSKWLGHSTLANLLGLLPSISHSANRDYWYYSSQQWNRA